MIDGKTVRVEKSAAGHNDTYVITLTNSSGVIVWSSEALGKEQTIDMLLQIGLASCKIPAKFADAEARAAAKLQPAE